MHKREAKMSNMEQTKMGVILEIDRDYYIGTRVTLVLPDTPHIELTHYPIINFPVQVVVEEKGMYAILKLPIVQLLATEGQIYKEKEQDNNNA